MSTAKYAIHYMPIEITLNMTLNIFVEWVYLTQEWYSYVYTVKGK